MAVTQKAAIYCRISERDERYDKVEVQEERCRALAKRFGYEVAERHVYVDDGISGYRFVERPRWRRLLAAIPSGEFDLILATEETRFTRQPVEKNELELACIAAGVTWHTELEGPTDPRTSDGAFMSDIRSAVARQESRRKAERQRAAFDARIATGQPLWGGRPFGYEADRVTLNETEASEIRWATDILLRGGSLYSIIRRWNELGVRTARGNKWSYAQVQQVLSRPRNAGFVESHGEILEGVEASWAPIITRDEYRRLIAILRDPARSVSRSREPRWLCAGLALCGVCGSTLRSAGASDKTGRYTVYRCSTRMNAESGGRRHSAHRADTLDELVAEAVVSSFLFGPTRLMEMSGEAASDVSLIAERLSRIRREKENLVEVAKLGGVDAAVRQQLGALNREEDVAEAELRQRELASANAAMLVESHRALLGPGRVSLSEAATVRGQLRARFDRLSLIDRRTLVRELLTVTVNPGRSPDRVVIEHRYVPSLNSGADDEP